MVVSVSETCSVRVRWPMAWMRDAMYDVFFGRFWVTRTLCRRTDEQFTVLASASKLEASSVMLCVQCVTGHHRSSNEVQKFKIKMAEGDSDRAQKLPTAKSKRHSNWGSSNNG